MRRWILPLLLILAAGGAGILALALRGRTGEEPPAPAEGPAEPPPPAPPAEETRFTLLFGGGLDGRLWTPPCSQFRQGGLSRLRPVIDAVVSRSQSGILLDTGDICGAPGRAGAAEATAALRVLQDVGLAVTAVGEKDLLAGLDAWKRLKNEVATETKVLCANLRDERDRELVPAVAHFQIGTKRLLVTATLSPSFEAGIQAAGVPVRLLPAAAAVRQALETAGAADFVVLLSHATPDETRVLLRELPGVDVAIAAHGGALPWLEPEVVDGRLLFYPGGGWQFVCGAAFKGSGKRRPELQDTLKRAVGWTVQPDRSVGMFLDAALKDLRAPGALEEAYGERSSRAPPDAPRHAGPSACLRCHAAAHSGWSEGRHARSMAAVIEKGYEKVPFCLSCHATAPGSPGGFPDPAGEQSSVSCEACHGPGASHASEEGRPRLADARASCAACHVPEMSPSFNFEEAWPKVRHGK
jgi:hypothetical protein